MTSWPFDRCGSSSRVAPCGGVAKSRLPPIEEGLDVRVAHARVLVLVRVRRPCVEQRAAGPDQVGAGLADDRPAGRPSRRRAEPAASALATAATSPQTDRSGRRTAPERHEPRPLASPFAAASSVSIVQGAGSGAASGGRLHQPEERGDPHVAFLTGRNHQRSGMSAYADGATRRGRRSAPAGRVLRAERGVAADLLVGRLRVPDEVARRVDADHHRPVDALRVAPGVDHRRARPGALAQRGRCGRSRAPCARPRDRRPAAAGCSRRGRRPRPSAGRRRPGTRRVRAVGLLAEEVGRALERRLDLGAVEHRRSRPCRGSRRARRRGRRRTGSPS